MNQLTSPTDCVYRNIRRASFFRTPAWRFYCLCILALATGLLTLCAHAQKPPDVAAQGAAHAGQTWMKVILGTGYEKPVQIHIFADHYRAPWYAHYAISKDGLEKGVNPRGALFSNGESTGWVNITPMVYPDSGARLSIYPAYRYGDNAQRFQATVEFANRPSDDAVTNKLDVDSSPSTLYIVLPPNLDSAENVARLYSDKDSADAYGKIADSYAWPKIGKAPVKFPFFVRTNLELNAVDARVSARELKTLSYFGFNGIGEANYGAGFPFRSIGGVGWYTKGSYSAPDLGRMQARADEVYQSQKDSGMQAKDIAFAMVMDEPGGERLAKLAGDEASIEGFRNWIKSMNLTPRDLLVSSWDEVKPVTDEQKDALPALYYYTEKYRTIALGNFIGLQKQMLQAHWKSNFPVVANFSDGAVYSANFYRQGVDYFALLHDTNQNAIWSEDWSNGAATYQDAAYNVELMRAAARKNGQTLGQYLIAYAGRKGYDIRLKAVSEAARGVKIFISYNYGPMWATHDRSAWQKSTSIWGDHASVVREIGAVEDLLVPAMPQKARVAILYSSASDVWNQTNLVYGFERMNTWLALTHAQIPVDVVHESEVPEGILNGYQVCYLADPNITAAAASRLRDWVEAGGTLVMTAGAGAKDEYNRPMDGLDSLLAYKRLPVQTLETFKSSGRYLSRLKPQDTVAAGNARIDVLGVKQIFAGVAAGGQTKIESTFSDGTPASVRSGAGKGWVICEGYLPALDYIYTALVAKGPAKRKHEASANDNGVPGPEDNESATSNEKSYNPWQYPPEVRNFIVAPVHTAGIDPPIHCSAPLVDAVYMTSSQGTVIPLANWSLMPIGDLRLDIAIDGDVHEVRSVHQGILKYERLSPHEIRVNLPLDCTDFVTIR